MSTFQEHHTTLGSGLGLHAKTLSQYGLNPAPILRQAGLDPYHPTSPDQRLPVRSLQKVWRLAVEYTGDPCYGLTYAGFIQPASLHGLGLAWLASDSLLDGLKRLVRYQRAISTLMDLELVAEDTTYKLIFNHDAGHLDLSPASVDATLAGFFHICRMAAGPHIHPVEVSLRHAKPDCAKRFDNLFGVEVSFDQTESAVVLDKSMTEKPLIGAHPELARVNDQMVIDYLGRFDKSQLLTQVRAKIIEQLPNGLPQQEKIAHELNLSLRGLQRKLNVLGTNYKAIMDEVRNELAVQYLKGSDRPIIEIGFLLGFSEASNFARAFNRWQGMSPRAYRDHPPLLQ